MQYCIVNNIKHTSHIFTHSSKTLYTSDEMFAVVVVVVVIVIIVIIVASSIVNRNAKNCCRSCQCLDINRIKINWKECNLYIFLLYLCVRVWYCNLSDAVKRNGFWFRYWCWLNDPINPHFMHIENEKKNVFIRIWFRIVCLCFGCAIFLFLTCSREYKREKMT